MARTKRAFIQPAEPVLDQPKIAGALDALRSNELSLHDLAEQLGYDGALNPAALEDGIRFYQQRTAEACLELGKRLLLLKEAVAHGDFKSRIEDLGIEYTAAKRFMKAAVKFSKVATSQLFDAAGSQGKLIELLVLDDDEIAELGEGGTVRGIDLDKIDRMGVRELRAALREADAEATAKTKLLSEKNHTIDRLTTAQRRIQSAPPDKVRAETQKEALVVKNDALGLLRGDLRQALKKLAGLEHAAPGDAVLMASMVGELQAELSALREEFNLADASKLGDQELAADVAQWGQPVQKLHS